MKILEAKRDSNADGLQWSQLKSKLRSDFPGPVVMGHSNTVNMSVAGNTVVVGTGNVSGSNQSVAILGSSNSSDIPSSVLIGTSISVNNVSGEDHIVAIGSGIDSNDSSGYSSNKGITIKGGNAMIHFNNSYFTQSGGSIKAKSFYSVSGGPKEYIAFEEKYGSELNSGHTHNAGDITSGRMSLNRLPTNNNDLYTVVGVDNGGSDASFMKIEYSFLDSDLTNSGLAALNHAHAGEDITTGTLSNSLISGSVLRGDISGYAIGNNSFISSTYDIVLGEESSSDIDSAVHGGSTIVIGDNSEGIDNSVTIGSGSDANGETGSVFIGNNAGKLLSGSRSINTLSGDPRILIGGPGVPATLFMTDDDKIGFVTNAQTDFMNYFVVEQ